MNTTKQPLSRYHFLKTTGFDPAIIAHNIIKKYKEKHDPEFQGIKDLVLKRKIFATEIQLDKFIQYTDQKIRQQYHTYTGSNYQTLATTLIYSWAMFFAANPILFLKICK